MLRMTCFSTFVRCRPAPPAPVLLPPGGPHHHRAFPGHRAHTPQVPRERTGWSYVWIKDCIVEKNYPNFPSGKLDHWWNNFFTWSQHKIVILMANLCHFDWELLEKLILPPYSIKPYFCDYYIMNTLEVLPPVSAITLEYRCGSHAFGKLWEVSKTDHWAAFSWKLFPTHLASPASTVIIHPSILRVGYFQDDIAITLW